MIVCASTSICANHRLSTDHHGTKHRCECRRCMNSRRKIVKKFRACLFLPIRMALWCWQRLVCLYGWIRSGRCNVCRVRNAFSENVDAQTLSWLGSCLRKPPAASHNSNRNCHFHYSFPISTFSLCFPKLLSVSEGETVYASEGFVSNFRTLWLVNQTQWWTHAPKTCQTGTTPRNIFHGWIRSLVGTIPKNSRSHGRRLESSVELRRFFFAFDNSHIWNARSIWSANLGGVRADSHHESAVASDDCTIPCNDASGRDSQESDHFYMNCVK